MSTLIKLSDNRTLAFETYGDSEGYPILYCHGFPGSRLEAAHFHEAALKKQCQIISIDRPGMGLSEFDENRTVLSFAHDIDELTDQLNLKQFSMISHSGGAPFLLACAHLIPHKIKKASIVSGISPPELWSKKNGVSQKERILSELLKRASFLTTPMMYLTRMLLKNPEKMIQQMIKNMSLVDQELFKNVGSKKAIISAVQEAFRQTLKGPSSDMKLLFKPWGFKLQGIQTPIILWHAELDTQAPIAHARIYESHLPYVKMELIKNEGHISVMINYVDDILTSVLVAND